MNIGHSLRFWRDKINEGKAVLSRINTEIERLENRAQQLEKRGDDILIAQHIIQEVARQTQAQLEYHVSGIVSLAQAAVFDKPYEFVARFDTRGDKRKTTECHLNFKRDDEEMRPTEASGGGPVDVAAYALRSAFLSMEQPRSRRVMILDEPFGFVSVDLQHKCSIMVKEISKKLGLQIIMVSHKEELIDVADKVFRAVQKANGRTTVESYMAEER